MFLGEEKERECEYIKKDKSGSKFIQNRCGSYKIIDWFKIKKNWECDTWLSVAGSQSTPFEPSVAHAHTLTRKCGQKWRQQFYTFSTTCISWTICTSISSKKGCRPVRSTIFLYYVYFIFSIITKSKSCTLSNVNCMLTAFA